MSMRLRVLISPRRFYTVLVFGLALVVATGCSASPSLDSRGAPGPMVPVTSETLGGGATASYVGPEIFPDLATLGAAADLVVRARARTPDQIAISEVYLNRLNADPAAVRLRLKELPSDAPPLLGDPPLQAGAEYLLFLRSFYGAAKFSDGDQTFGVVGGPQGQWKLRNGQVFMEADAPLGARSGESLETILADLRGTDLRKEAAELLERHGWGKMPMDRAIEQRLSPPERLASEYDVQDWLAASRAIGLDFSPYAGQRVLWMLHGADTWAGGRGGVAATVLVTSEGPVGAWLRAGRHGLVFSLNQQQQALVAAADPSLGPTPTPTPIPLVAGSANLVDRLGLRDTVRIDFKSSGIAPPPQSGPTPSPAPGKPVPNPPPQSTYSFRFSGPLDVVRIVTALDTVLTARATTQAALDLTSDPTRMILFFEQPDGESVRFLYDPIAGRLASLDGWFEVDAPEGFAKALGLEAVP